MELPSCPPFYPVEGLFCDDPLSVHQLLSVFLFQESLLLCDMFRRRYKATRGSRFPNWFWLAVHVRDPIQMSVRQLVAADRLFDVRPQPKRRVVFPEWYVWSAFDSGPFGKSKPDQCIRILDSVARVYFPFQHKFHCSGC